MSPAAEKAPPPVVLAVLQRAAVEDRPVAAVAVVADPGPDGVVLDASVAAGVLHVIMVGSPRDVPTAAQEETVFALLPLPRLPP